MKLVKKQKEFLGMQAGDIKSTHANTSAIEEWTGFKPNTSLAIGIKKFVSCTNHIIYKLLIFYFYYF